MILLLLAALLVVWLVAVFQAPSGNLAGVVIPVLFLGGVGLTIYALWARAFWGRWLAQGLCAGGLVQLAALWFFLGPWWLVVGLPIAVLLGALCLLVAGRRMSDLYERSPSPNNRWNLEDRTVRILATSVVLNIGAVPMLLTYSGSGAWWIGPGRRIITVVVLGLLLLAIVFTILQRTAGLLLMALVGTAMVALAADALMAALGPSPPGLELGGCTMTPKEVELAGSIPAVAASIPGALSSIVTISAFARGIGRFLRRG